MNTLYFEFLVKSKLFFFQPPTVQQNGNISLARRMTFFFYFQLLENSSNKNTSKTWFSFQLIVRLIHLSKQLVNGNIEQVRKMTFHFSFFFFKEHFHFDFKKASSPINQTTWPTRVDLKSPKSPFKEDFTNFATKRFFHMKSWDMNIYYTWVYHCVYMCIFTHTHSVCIFTH